MVTGLSALLLLPASTAEAHRRPRRARAVAVRVAPTVERLDALAMCESGGDPTRVSRGSRYFGAFQFLPSTWRGIGETGMPHEASYEVQREAARRLVERSGWRTQFPRCSRKLGYR